MERRRLLDPVVDPSRTQLGDFTRRCMAHAGQALDEPIELHRWSVQNWQPFWREFVAWSGILHDGAIDPVCVGDGIEHARFFPDLRLNYTENLLHGGGVDPEAVAVVALDESGHRVELTRRQLATRVRRTALALRESGLVAGDQVVAIARNDLESIVACLASVGLGAVWSSVAPDLGVEAIVARFEGLRPKILFAHESTAIQGRAIDLRGLTSSLVRHLVGLKAVVSMGETSSSSSGPRLEDLQSASDEGFEWPRLPFDHPLFVMFSSGTTGAPKCIVHGAGGTLLEHLKEHRLHGDMGPADRLHFHTTCGWMMWNWQLTALACGSSIVVRDGSPTHPDLDALWRMVAKERVTVLGANPTYLQFCRDAGMRPGSEHDLSSLRAMQSTGSILYPEQFDWFFGNVARLPIHSISGGTDIIGCFVLGHPHRPLMRGESQMLSLAMDVRAVDGESGEFVGQGEVGELVCANPFPSRPVSFRNDPGGARFHEAYFAQREGLWTHGDFIEIHEDGGARILGRSDGVLNVRGVRIGPAEIYSVLRQFEQIVSAVAVEQNDESLPGGSRIVLLIVLRPHESLDRPLVLGIKKALKTQASANHVPGLVVSVPDLPVTFSGKLSEKAVREAVNGREIPNLGALKNPGCLEQIVAAVRESDA